MRLPIVLNYHTMSCTIGFYRAHGELRFAVPKVGVVGGKRGGLEHRGKSILNTFLVGLINFYVCQAVMKSNFFYFSIRKILKANFKLEKVFAI